MMSLARRILSVYRLFQFGLFGRYRTGVMMAGNACFIGALPPSVLESGHNDVIHPCVRFIPDGFEGHRWWMVYTPYYLSDSATENPILCYADNDGEDPPLDWQYYCVVNEKPKDGYNSDPTLVYLNKQLFVAWRENIEKNPEKYGYARATFVARVSHGTVYKLDNPILSTSDKEEDAETCPTFMVEESLVVAYGMHLKFHSYRVKRLPQPWQKIANRILLVTDLLGLYSQQKHYGVSIWKGAGAFIAPFQYEKTVRFQNCNPLYRPWHMDLFDVEGIRYAVVQTNQCNADIALARSIDHERFEFFKKPLITNKTIHKLGIYKPCAGVTSRGRFYLYYTAQDLDDRRLNKLYMTMMPFKKLLEDIG